MSKHVFLPPTVNISPPHTKLNFSMPRRILSGIMRNKLNVCRYSSQIISEYLRRFLVERKGVLNSSEIEPVHRMRVASRRLRAALNAFKGMLPAKKTKIWTREISKIGRVLGQARQLDVQIKFLESAKKRLKNNLSIFHVEVVIKSLKKKRRQTQKQINIVLEGFEAKKRLPELSAYLGKLSSGKHMCPIDQSNLPEGTIILKRLNKLLVFVPYVSKPQSIKELHRMRIAAKKLRYTLEIYRPYHGSDFDKYIRASRDIQDLLGDLHEFDCLAGVLADFSKKPCKDFKDTVSYLIQECARKRQAVYIKFIRLWSNLEKTRMWEKLKREF